MQYHRRGILIDFAEYRLKDNLKNSGILYGQDARGKFKIWWRFGKLLVTQKRSNVLPFRLPETPKS